MRGQAREHHRGRCAVEILSRAAVVVSNVSSLFVPLESVVSDT